MTQHTAMINGARIKVGPEHAKLMEKLAAAEAASPAAAIDFGIAPKRSGSLLTRHRPRSFDEVLGQGALVASLQSAIKGKLGRAFLFTGPSGVGKTTLARLTAAALGCTVLWDLTEVDAATHTGIDDMRGIGGRADMAFWTANVCF